MRRDPIAPASTFRILNETQNAVFDTEYHAAEELDIKFKLLNDVSSDESFNVLDLGGGNGLFADQLLARFPRSTVTILEISCALLSRNDPSKRKELIHGSIEEMTDVLTGRTFDYISMNWVLHHLVGNSYRASLENCCKTLIHCRKLLKPGGMVIIAENMFDSYLGSNLASHIIYAITEIKWRWFVQWTKRFFNTAGVGVCFQSERAWRRIFGETGFDVVAFQRGVVWGWVGSSLRGKAMHLLFVKSVSHGHFFLEPKPVG
jgi:2-polyprenyl-3-methyl-5-hydroxy-6-metoxy-1,4-benzoquinol methylase